MNSFDVFDTIVTRDLYNPVDLFYFTGKRLSELGILKASSPIIFQKARVEAERKARSLSVNEEVSLKEIYDQLKMILNLNDKIIQDIMNIEIELEKKSLVPILENVRMLNSYAILISDTYLDEEILKDLLSSCSIRCGNEYRELFTSTKYNKTKATGKLYDIVLKKYIIKRHIGDDKHSDLKIPARKGIPSVHYTRSQPSRYEKALYSCHLIPYELRAVLAGSMKAVRLSKYYTNLNYQIIHEVTSDVIAPFIFLYVHWVLEKAINQGIEKLYFLARDGQILHHVAKVINKKIFDRNIQLKYLYVSRKALFLPSIYEETFDEVFDWMIDYSSNLSIDRICERFQLPTVIRDKLKYQLNIKSNCKLSSMDIKRLKFILYNDPEIREQVLKISKIKRELTLEYLKQEGFKKSGRIGVVDIGWKGRLQTSLSRILYNNGIYPESGITGFYVGLARKPSFMNDTYYVFFDDTYSHILRFPFLYELFTSATHGMCLGYQKTKSGIVPVLKEEMSTEMINWGLEVQHKTTSYFTCFLTNNLMKYHVPISHQQKISEILLNLFFNCPTKGEAMVYGMIKHYPDQEEQEKIDICTKLSPLEFLIVLLLGARKTERLLHKKLPLWIEGSMACYFSSKVLSILERYRRTRLPYAKSRSKIKN